jgi:pimeloyl-ACP methyl ester carboxylesterase
MRYGPTHLGLMGENPSLAAFLGKLSSFSRLVLYDRLGNGLSDRGVGGYVFEDEMDDVRAVLAAVGSERAALFGCHIGGIAVHIAARVLGHAGAGEIVCSRTVKDLVAGSGFVFDDRGAHRLKGLPDSWQLYAVELAGG